MIDKRLDDVTESDIDALLTNAVPEGRALEYKQILPGMSDSEKKEFLADVSSFANSAGGVLLYGITEEQGVPRATPGIASTDVDADIRRLDGMINDGLDPRIRFAIRAIARQGQAPILAIKVEKSWIGPHRVTSKGHDKFYARTSAGKYPLDVAELRQAFTASGTAFDKARSFRLDRISKILDDRTPVPCMQGARIILHSAPLDSFSGQAVYGVLLFSNRPDLIPPMSTGTSWTGKINLDGYVTYSPSGDGGISYTQLFRNGTIESVECRLINHVDQNGDRFIPYIAFEKRVMQYLERCLTIQKGLGVMPPLMVALTLTETKGMKMAHEPLDFDDPAPIEEDHLILPESMVESYDEPVGKVLKPIFDLVWNASGYAKSKNFDDQGNWIQTRG